MQKLTKNIAFKLGILIASDIVFAAMSFCLGLFVCAEFSVFSYAYTLKIIYILKFWLPINFLVFVVFKMYSRLWRFASIIEGLRVFLAAFCSSVCLVFVVEILGLSVHKACYFETWVFLSGFTFCSRFCYRILQAFRKIQISNLSDSETKRIMIIGAGYAANALIREIEKDKCFLRFKAVCLIDDDSTKKNKYIGSAKVVGGRDKIIWAAEHYHVDEIIFAIPAADSKTRHDILSICLNTSCVIKTLPSYYQMISGKISVSMLKKIEISDLLERPQIELELDNINEFIMGKKVLITGAGGSIGSELCRQLAKFSPKRLILFDIYENNIYFIQNELKEIYPELDVVTLIGSVRDANRLDYIFSFYRPDIVYHAAAHKHVPLMENSPHEAVKNNVMGTLNLVCAADKYSVSRFVLISTDKAVNPTNVMGATKRICELIIQYYDRHSKTDYVAVRFGNVLGSNGSVIPIFRQQIENGGPVTVTHPDIIRYFMTIPEAVSLVLQAGSYAQSGEIFILDMGEPVKVLNLAENMIRLSGLVPYKDIDIEFSGLRPGEKIFEELLMSEEGLTETQNKKIFIGKPINLDEEKFLQQLQKLKQVMEDESTDIRSFIREIVPTYNFNKM